MSGEYESRQLIAGTIAKLTASHVNKLVDAAYPYNLRGGRSDLNRVLVVSFFACYTFLTGVMAMLLFRMSRRRVGVYTFVTVVGASVLAGLLGGYLRFSRGDLRCVTVTQPGAGGVVQVGRITVQSAGGRNTHVAINGSHADLQLIGGNSRYDPWRQVAASYPPFTWQPNLANGADDTYQINVPIAPWGRRRCHATAFSNQIQRLDFELDFAPTPRPGRHEAEPSAGVVPGEFSLKLANHLPFDITECFLVIGAPYSGGQAGEVSDLSVPGLTDVYLVRRIADLSPGATLEETFGADFETRRNDWGAVQLQWSSGFLTVPRLEHLGAASAWIIGVIEESPAMTIDEERSDFVPQDHLHILVQEIRPEDMPDASLFTVGDGVE